MSDFNRRMDAILAALDEFGRLLTPERPSDLGAFVRGRIVLSRAASEFLSNEWQNLSQAIAGHVPGSTVAQAAIHQKFIKLRSEYSQHVARWDSARLVREWSAYQADCQSLIQAMRALIEVRCAENRRIAA